MVVFHDMDISELSFPKNKFPTLSLPSQCTIFINELRISLPGTANLMDLTKYLSLGINCVRIQHNPTTALANYFVVWNIMKTIKWEDLITKIGRRSKLEALEFVRKTFNSNSDILQLSHRISLLDVNGLSRIKIPCRSIYCSHLSVFDLEIYLQINDHSRNWKCPLCGKSALVDGIYIDAFFEEILSTSDTNEVTIFENGSWEIEKKSINSEEDEYSKSDVTSNQERTIEIVDLTDD